uniref:5'-nucleotidase n=1 Tax=Acrobeloides nanus TaxID=290746 RepID=A0A914DNS9_9BILA
MRKTNANPPDISPTDRDIVSMVHLADPSVPLAGLRYTRPVSVADKALVSISRHMTKLALSSPQGWIDSYWLTLCFNKLLSKIFDDEPQILRGYLAEVKSHIKSLEEKIRDQEVRQHSQSPEMNSTSDETPAPSKHQVTCFEGVDDDRICLWFRSAGGFWLCEEPLLRLWDKICTGEAVGILLKTVLFDLLTAVAQQWFAFKDSPQVPADLIMKNFLTKEMEIKIIARSIEKLVAKKIQQIAADGLEKILYIVDFDQTLSRSTLDENGDNGVKKNAKNTLDIIYDFAQKSEEHIKNKFNAIGERYIEYMSRETDGAKKAKFEEKISVEFYDEIVNSRITYDKFDHFVKNSGIKLRSKVQEKINLLENFGIPMVIFSAGVGNAIEIILKNELKDFPKNGHLISNMLYFNEEGIVSGYTTPLIHLYNKQTDVAKHGEDFLKSHADRSNIILIGDSLCDINMDEIVQLKTNVLKIGFLNFEVEKLLETYMENFDIVLVEDQTMDVPIDLLKMLCNK